MTLKEFVKKEGGVYPAAKTIGVPPKTLYRWLKSTEKMTPLAKNHLKCLGVEVPIQVSRGHQRRRG